MTTIGPVLVVGTGLMGTSVGLALRRADVTVHLADADPEVLAVAAARGAGSAAPPPQPPAVVVVGVPPAVAGRVLAEQLARWPDATVTDLTSVKSGPLGDVARLGGDLRRLVGSHPMAGREVSGPAGARADLLDDRVWVLTPTPRSDARRVDEVRRLAVACGAVPVELAPEAHDRAVAVTSHTPQVLASLAAGRLLDADAEQVAVSGQGLRDVTRIAGSDPALWAEILSANAGPVAEVLAAVRDDLDDVVTALRALAAQGPASAAAGSESAVPGEPASRAVLTDVLLRGNLGHARVPGKHGAVPSPFATVPVLLADRPGQLALLFGAAGEAGVNLEDVRIEHVLGRPSGLVEISVRPESEPALVRALRERGFDVRD